MSKINKCLTVEAAPLEPQSGLQKEGGSVHRRPLAFPFAHLAAAPEQAQRVQGGR